MYVNQRERELFSLSFDTFALINSISFDATSHESLPYFYSFSGSRSLRRISPSKAKRFIFLSCSAELNYSWSYHRREVTRSDSDATSQRLSAYLRWRRSIFAHHQTRSPVEPRWDVAPVCLTYSKRTSVRRRVFFSLLQTITRRDKHVVSLGRRASFCAAFNGGRSHAIGLHLHVQHSCLRFSTQRKSTNPGRWWYIFSFVLDVINPLPFRFRST